MREKKSSHPLHINEAAAQPHYNTSTGTPKAGPFDQQRPSRAHAFTNHVARLTRLYSSLSSSRNCASAALGLVTDSAASTRWYSAAGDHVTLPTTSNSGTTRERRVSHDHKRYTGRAGTCEYSPSLPASRPSISTSTATTTATTATNTYPLHFHTPSSGDIDDAAG